MTEYDYSPAAWQQHLAKQKQIAKWADHCSAQKHKQGNPFLPSATARDSAFYRATPTTPSELYGPDRPPTPPATGYGSGYGYGAGVYGAGYATTPNQGPNVLSPTWNGYAWVYQPLTTTQANGVSSSRGSKRDHHGHGHHRHKSHHRSSTLSVPPPNIASPFPPVNPWAPPAQYYNYAQVPNISVSPNMVQTQSQFYSAGSNESRHKHRSASGSVAYTQTLQSPPGAAITYPNIIIVEGAKRRDGGSKLKKGRH